ncbi:MAG: recombinase family protein, partial [Clostridia bacterium]|nr:recombinase family protein [Clostridia bacterium]
MARKPINTPEATGVIYARFSSHNQREESIEQQVAECKAFAALSGIKIVGVYSDSAKTGRTDRRPQFQKLQREAQKGGFNYIIAYKSNRIARNILNALMFENEMEKLGIKVVYAKEEFGNNAAGRFALR